MSKTKTASKVKYEPVLQLPPLSYEEFTALRDNIAVNGVLVPILVDSDGPRRKIIDGNFRKRIADELGYDCPEIVQPGMEEDEKRALARALNLARRQLNADQKRELIADQLKRRPTSPSAGSPRCSASTTPRLAACVGKCSLLVKLTSWSGPSARMESTARPPSR